MRHKTVAILEVGLITVHSIVFAVHFATFPKFSSLQIEGYVQNLSPHTSSQPIASRVYQRLLYLLTNQIAYQRFEFSTV